MKLESSKWSTVNCKPSIIQSMTNFHLCWTNEDSSLALLRNRSDLKTGVSSSIAVSLEGTRPILLEVQALCSPSRNVSESIPFNFGVNPTRLFMINAILRRHIRCRLDRMHVLVNVTGGMKMKEPAGDLAVAVAIASAYFDRPLVNHGIWNGFLFVLGTRCCRNWWIGTWRRIETRCSNWETFGRSVAAWIQNGKLSILIREMDRLGRRTENENATTIEETHRFSCSWMFNSERSNQCRFGKSTV